MTPDLSTVVASTTDFATPVINTGVETFFTIFGLVVAAVVLIAAVTWGVNYAIRKIFGRRR